MSTPRRLSIVLALLAALGLAVRLRAIAQPPFDFHPTRQYYALLFAQDYRHTLCGDPRSAEALAARENRLGEALLEPPVVPAVTALGWCLAGTESIALPRVLGALAWCAGAVALGLLVRALGGGAVAAVLAAAWMLFHPYAIAAGRSVQPDGPMVVLLVGGALALVRWLDARSPRWIRAASVCFGAAVFAKLVAVFFVAPLLAATALAARRERGRWASEWGRAWGLWLVGSMLPAALWYADGWWGHGFLRAQGQGRFQPHLLATAFFWRELAARLATVTGLLPLGLACAAALLAMRGRARAVALAWLVGQAALGVVFTFHIHTHDYYALPLVPWVGLALGLGVEAIARGRRWVGGVALLGAALLAVRGVDRAWRRSDAAAVDAGEVVADARRIGDAVGHGRDVLMQARWYGLPTKFHGRFAAEYWPDHFDLEGDPHRWSPAERIDRGYHGRRFGWFVVADPRERALQPALWQHLGRSAVATVQTPTVAVYRLRAPSGHEVGAPVLR